MKAAKEIWEILEEKMIWGIWEMTILEVKKHPQKKKHQPVA